VPVRDLYGRTWNGTTEVELFGGKAEPVSDVQAAVANGRGGTGWLVCGEDLLERRAQYGYLLVRSSAADLSVRRVCAGTFCIGLDWVQIGLAWVHSKTQVIESKQSDWVGFAKNAFRDFVRHCKAVGNSCPFDGSLRGWGKERFGLFEECSCFVFVVESELM
jgi:hypothetical protein